MKKQGKRAPRRNNVKHGNPKKTRLPSDSLLVSIPLNLTVDLGVVMRHCRLKRIQRLRRLYPCLFHDKSCDNQPTKASEEETKDNDDNDDENERKQTSDEGELINRSTTKQRNKKSLDSAGEEGIVDCVPKRDQYGSVLDYLEAKYAKGVMIDDQDEKLLQVKKQEQEEQDGKKLSTANANGEIKGGGTEETNNIASSSSESGSCYSDDSGNFLDDSELQTDVALQVLAGSAFGTTKIEAESAKSYAKLKQEHKHKNQKIFKRYQQDDSFFVNVGDLEMEDGFEGKLVEAEDWMRNPRKKEKSKKRKRSSVKNVSSTKHSVGDTKIKKKPKKKIEGLPRKGPPSRKEIVNKSSKPKHSKIKVNSTQIGGKKKHAKRSLKLKERQIKRKVSEKQGSNNGDDEKRKTPDKGKSSVVTKTTKPIILSKKQSEDKSELHLCKMQAAEAKSDVRKLYNRCVEELSTMNQDQLPRNPKKAGSIKVQIIVPSNKKGGEKITFSNPLAPSQTLKVIIPINEKPGGKFVVRVPKPKICQTSHKQNKFSKEFTDMLNKYSLAFDEWGKSEAKYRTTKQKITGKKVTPFKPGVERLKKFDEMLKQFPDDMAFPVNAVLLRLHVRRARQNASKRLKTLAALEQESLNESQEKDATSESLKLMIPGDGTIFPAPSFTRKDFVYFK